MVKINFRDIAVSTKTIIGISNAELDIEKIFNKLPITPYVVIQRRRGRKKKEQEPDPNQNIQIGSIITAKLGGLIKGVDLKQKKKTDSRRKYFRNSLTIVMKIDKDKLINFKLSKNGKFQITDLVNGYFDIRISYVGYETKLIYLNLISDSTIPPLPSDTV